ncbi:MAG: LPS-assembly protein LptD [Bacteroidetes bacterium]|nr:LPS-assembly protein LptD [Bacteroidota bacterium]
MKVKKAATILFSRQLLILPAVYFSFPFFIFAQDTAHVKTSDTIHATTPDTSVSESAIKSKVIYSARDSMRMDLDSQKVFLYGEGNVKYEELELNADYIEFNMKTNIAFSRGARDSSGNVRLDSAGNAIGDPVFKQGEKSFDAKEITYNFETKKGKIREITTVEGEAFIHARDAKKDTGDVYYVKNGRYTTCDLEHPHFYIKTTKLKVIPDDKIISGPAYVVIGDVPLPLVLPFGIFPNKTGRKSGVLIPFYGESNLGYFLKDGGYYFGMSDFFDLALRGDFYSKGSFGVKTHSNYIRRYKYSGNVQLSYSNIQISEKEFPDYSRTQDFFLRWSHMQDAKASPTSRFSANVNAGTSTYQKYNSYNANDYLSNTFQSNIAWNKSWQGSPNNLSINASHSQNTKTKIVDVTLPDAAFTMGRRFPFKRRDFVGKPNVIDKIGISPSFNAKNFIRMDSAFFKDPYFVNKLSDRMQNGIKASAPITTSWNLGPLIFSPSISANAYGYFQTIHKRWDADSSRVFTDTLRTFKYGYDYSTSLTTSTKLYGMFAFRHGIVKAIRHVMTPSASLSWRPDFSQKQYGFYEDVQTNTFGNTQSYSIFQNGIFGSPASGKSGVITLGLDNNLEMKLRPAKKDTSTKDRKIVLIDNLRIASSYNIAAENFNWSTTNLSARTRLFKKVDITLSSVLDPYAYDNVLKKRIEKFEYQVNGKLYRLTDAAFALSTSLRSLTQKKTAKTTGKKTVKKNVDELNYIMSHPDYYVDFNVPWDLAVNYNVVYSKPGASDTVIQSFTFSGNVNVTEKWKVGFRSGFDFVKKNFTFTSFDIYRDLHCWEMHLNWIPFGFRRSYMLTLNVKASVLQDLKLERKRDWYDYN